MSMRQLSDTERVMLAQFRLCTEETQTEIQALVHEKAQNAQAQTAAETENTRQE